MTDRTVLREVTVTLPLAPDVELAASRAATAIAQSIEMSPDKIDEVRLAVVEACLNALEHSRSRDGKLHLTFSVLGKEEPARLQIKVQDAGVGFLPQAVEEPVIEEKLRARRKRGWGLKIIRGLMDEVEIQSGAEGTTIVMSKAR